jgi:hypothetical protein
LFIKKSEREENQFAANRHRHCRAQRLTFT